MNKFKIFRWFQLTDICGFVDGGEGPVLENILNTMYSKGYKFISVVSEKEKGHTDGLFIFETI
jgi:hypothetical protein